MLEQRQIDLIGLGLVALGVFAGFVIYLGWDGGEAGEGLVDGVAWLIGAVHWTLPLALFAAGAILVLRPVLPTLRPFRAGAVCLFVALSLGLAAGTLGVGPVGERGEFWDGDFVRERGGMVGEALFWTISKGLGTIGAHIVAVFLALAGILLITGASIAGVVRATSTQVASTGRRVRDTTQELRARLPVPRVVVPDP